MIDLFTVTSDLEILQAIRRDAQEAGNRRLAAALTVAISELIQASDNVNIDSDLRRYNELRRRDPRLTANVKLIETPQTDGTISCRVET